MLIFNLQMSIPDILDYITKSGSQREIRTNLPLIFVIYYNTKKHS